MPVDIGQVLLNPSGAFTAPDEIVHCQELTTAQEIEALHRRAYDIRELRVAEGEGMQGQMQVMLEQILRALHALDAAIDLEHGPPTEHGGF